ncbi:sugar ABC transporter permease [Peribacillus muralis]|uniref:carbohydrate ABC transporter permease n=1 Tax=Peribacillus muralis TaxID=264697 RepID=UPI001F4D676D|nr:sugar ABC transporter permease [Peribacillus muralis]MCK1992955.1 sugar ABC transporter permease [Peribacillus muralis]MCK2013510.1 sugar ABC transporter permease [Peribacillus muralis]
MRKDSEQRGLFLKIKTYLGRDKFQSKVFILLVMIPTAIWFFTFMFYPIFLTFKNSFTDANLAFNEESFIGLENYRRLMTDSGFHIALKNTIFSVIYIVPATLVLSLALALLLNSFSKRIRETFTLFYFLPVITSMVAISIVWSWLYNPSYGLFNILLNFFGFPAQGFLTSSKQALPSISIIQVWKDVGFYAVIFLAALRTIPKSYYEAATVDGATKFQVFRYITRPLLKPTLIFVSIVSTISAFKIFDGIKVLTDGGPGNNTMVLVLYIIRKGIDNAEIGYAAAIAVVMFFIVLIITLIQWFLTRADKN